MYQSLKKLMVIFISSSNFILNSSSTVNIKSNNYINTINWIFPETNFKNGTIENIDISSLFILGFDKYIYDINDKIQLFFSKIIIIHSLINYIYI